VVVGRIYVSGFLSLDFLPMLWFISVNGDMEEGGSDCIAREEDNQNTFTLVLIKFHPQISWYSKVSTNLYRAMVVKQPRNNLRTMHRPKLELDNINWLALQVSCLLLFDILLQ